MRASVCQKSKSPQLSLLGIKISHYFPSGKCYSTFTPEGHDIKYLSAFATSKSYTISLLLIKSCGLTLAFQLVASYLVLSLFKLDNCRLNHLLRVNWHR